MLSQFKQVLRLSAGLCSESLWAVCCHSSNRFYVCLQDYAVSRFEQYAVTVQTGFASVCRTMQWVALSSMLSQFKQVLRLSTGLCSESLWAVLQVEGAATGHVEGRPVMKRAEQRIAEATCPPFQCMLGGSPECQAVCTPMWIDPVLCSDTDSAVAPG